MFKTIMFIIMSLAGIWYGTKYIDQYRKIKRLSSSQGISRTYFIKGIIYESICFVSIILILLWGDWRAISAWILFILTIIPLIGNIIVFIMAVKYSPYSRKRRLKHKFYNWIRSW